MTRARRTRAKQAAKPPLPPPRPLRHRLFRWLLGTAFLSLCIVALTAAQPGTLRRTRQDAPAEVPTVPEEKTVTGNRAAAKEVEESFEFLSTPDDAVRMALSDLATIDEFHRQYIRYLWIPDGDYETWQALSLAMNLFGRASGPIPLPAVGLGPPTKELFDRKAYLLRVDLSQFFPQRQRNDLQEGLELWEEFRFDTGSLAKLVTKDTIAILTAEQRSALPVTQRKKTVAVPAVFGPEVPETQEWGNWFLNGVAVPKEVPGAVWRKDGDRPTGKMLPGKLITPATTKDDWEPVPFDPATTNALRFNRGDIDPVALLQLQEVTHSQAPVVEAGYFVTRALNTLEDDGLFKDVWGGLYYRGVGIKKAKDVLGADTKATDQDLFFQDHVGLGNVKGGETVDQLFDRLRSDRRLAIRVSGITGKPRDVSEFLVPAANVKGPGWITGDILNKKVDVGDRSFANLIDPRRDAREGIFPRGNGLLKYVLFNGQGALQVSVPEGIAHDRTIPAPYTVILQGPSGCISCHAPFNQFQPLRNDVARTLTRTRADIFDDLAGKKGDPFDNRDRIAGLVFGGDFRKNLADAREGWDMGVLEVTGPWKDSPTNLDVGKLAAAKVTRVFHDYWYPLLGEDRAPGIGAREALRTLGVVAPKGREVETIIALVPPDVRLRVDKIILTDARELGVFDGGEVTRQDWQLVLPFVAERARPRVELLKEAEAKRRKR